MQVRCRRESFGLLPRFHCCRSVFLAARGQVTRGVCASRCEVLLGLFVFCHICDVSPRSWSDRMCKSHLCRVTAVEGNEGIIHCIIIEWQKPGLTTQLPLMDPGHYLLDESSSPHPSLLLPLSSRPSTPNFCFLSSLLPSCPPPPKKSLSCLIVILLPPHSHFPRDTSTSLLHSPRSSLSSSRSPSEAERDVAEEDIPGGRCHQYCQSSAAPWGPLELVSDWNTPTHMKTSARSHYIPSILVHMVLISRKYLTRGSCLFHFKTN